MIFTPDTNVRLLSVVLEPGYSNTLWFPDVATQAEYFTSKTVKFLEDNQYVKPQDGYIEVEGSPEQYYNINYLMYQNNNISNKWFYAFITSVEWASMHSTRLVLEQDVIQTWFFNVQMRNCFIERMHTVTDNLGGNIVPEPIGGAKLHYEYAISYTTNGQQAVILATCDETGKPISGETIDRFTYSGVGVRKTNIATLPAILNRYVQNGLADAVVGIYLLPLSFPYDVPDRGEMMPKLRPENIDGYTPKNKKLLSGCFISNFVSYMGQELEFNPEYVGVGTSQYTPETKFKVNIKIDELHGAVVIAVPLYGLSSSASTDLFPNYPSPLTMYIQLPKSTWSYNTYENNYNLHSASNAIYVERSKQNRGLGAFNASAQALSGASQAILGSVSKLTSPAAVVNPFGAINGAIQQGIGGAQSVVNGGIQFQQYASGIDEITQSLTEIEENLNAPATGNLTQSNPYTQLNLTDLFVGYKTPNRRIAMQYDNFLTMFGYAIKNLDTPSRHNRKAFTYLQAPDLEVEGNIPGDAIMTIKQAHKAGVRYWVYNKTYMDFMQDNGVL